MAMVLNIGSANSAVNLIKSQPAYQPQVEQESNPTKRVEENLLCTNCQQPYRPGELVCVHCGVLFGSAGKTQQLNTDQNQHLNRVRRVGEAVTNDVRPISFIINGLLVELPVQNELIIGRKAEDPNSLQIDVDLSPFQALQRGVSRQHIKISRDRGLLYITDLESSNGTYLNGFKLIAHQQRLLRNGDELMLGRLTVTIKF